MRQTTELTMDSTSYPLFIKWQAENCDVTMPWHSHPTYVHVPPFDTSCKPRSMPHTPGPCSDNSPQYMLAMHAAVSDSRYVASMHHWSCQLLAGCPKLCDDDDVSSRSDRDGLEECPSIWAARKHAMSSSRRTLSIAASM